MKSLFLKIFLWFWLAQILIGVALYALTMARQRSNIDQGLRSGAGDNLEARARAAAVAYELGGVDGLRSAWRFPARPGPEDRAHAAIYLVRKQPGSPPQLLAGPPLPDAVASVVAEAVRNGQAHLSAADGSSWLARRFETPRGGRYVAAQRMRPRPGFGSWPGAGPGPGVRGRAGPRGRPEIYGPIAWISSPDTLPRFVVVALVLGAVCFALARYLTAPAVKLSRATHQLAAGDLSVRVAPQMGRRRDELADLGRDFDMMAERIENLLRSERRLLGDISHELRSPLARLMVALDLAEDDATPQAQEYLQRIRRESERLNELIGQLLMLTRLETAGAETKREPVNLAHLVQEIASDADFEAKGRNRVVQIKNLEECMVMGNPDLLRSAIENVVRNAVRYTREETNIEITLQKEAAASEKVRKGRQATVVLEPANAVIRVRDHGPGVPEAALKRLFDPFYRVEDARDRQSGGVGLGLSITARAVRLHGGEVTAQNAPENGLIVEIRLPLTTKPSLA